MRDVAIIGSGHNALVAACYLARAGLDVEVFERDTVLGGAVSTVPRWPGYRVDRGSSAHIMIRHTGIVEDLRLGADDLGPEALRYLDLDPWAFFPTTAGDGAPASISFFVDLDRTCASIAAVCGNREADAYRGFATEWGRRNARVMDVFARPPTGGVLARGLLGIGRGGPGGATETARQFLSSGDALLDEHFADERLKTALAWLGAQAGPPTHEPATAELIGWTTLMHRRAPGRAVGGSGALTGALVARLRSYGGSVRSGEGVTRILRSPGGRVLGVETDSGERVPARSVLAGCHVLTTLELLGDEALLARARRAVRVGDGMGVAIRLGTRALPVYSSARGTPARPGADDGSLAGSPYSAMQLLAASRAQLRLAHGQARAGLLPPDPPVLLMTFSALDPSIAPPGRHNLTAWAQWHPYRLAGGRSWDDEEVRGTLLDSVLRQVEMRAPGFSGSVEHAHVQTPLDLERELGLRRGNVMHVDMSLESMFAFRPLPELAGYRTLVPGLYLTGASTHPGGGVYGASGRSAARVLLADRAAQLRRSRVRMAVPWRRGREAEPRRGPH